MSLTWLPAGPVTIEGDGLVLREWAPSDLAALVALYDTPEMDRRTPVPFPFTVDVARRYVENARLGRDEARLLQLAITEDGARALGEILVAPTDEAGTVELAYAVAYPHTGRGIAGRAVRSILHHLASTAGSAVDCARALITEDNLPSQGVARANGFVRTDRPMSIRRRKGMELQLATWERPVPAD